MVEVTAIGIMVTDIATVDGCVFGNTAIIAKSDHAGATGTINASIKLT